MSINKTIDQIVEAFIPEMRKISQTHESEEQKERHYKAWLRATLQKFADDVMKTAAHDKQTDCHGATSPDRGGGDVLKEPSREENKPRVA